MGATRETGVKLLRWAGANQPEANWLSKVECWTQILFVRDTVATLLARTSKELTDIQTNMVAIAEHTSMSVRLPVFQVKLADGTMFTMRYNFHDWKVSVNSPRDVEADFMGLFKTTESIRKVEGFPQRLVYGPYSKNRRRFTFKLPDSYHLFTFFWIFARKVLGNPEKDKPSEV